MVRPSAVRTPRLECAALSATGYSHSYSYRSNGVCLTVTLARGRMDD